MSRDYELGIILSPEVNEEGTRSFLNRLEQIATKDGGQIVRTTQWGRRRLAYPIERHRDGSYIFLDSILTTEAVAEIERILRVSEIVLRYMLRKRNPKIVRKEREAHIAAEAAKLVEAAKQAEAEAAAAVEAEAAKQAEAAATVVETETVVTTVEVTTPTGAIADETIVTTVETETPVATAEAAPAPNEPLVVEVTEATVVAETPVTSANAETSAESRSTSEETSSATVAEEAAVASAV